MTAPSHTYLKLRAFAPICLYLLCTVELPWWIPSLWAICWALQFTGSMKLIKSTQKHKQELMVWSMSFYAAFVCKAKIGCRLRVKGPFGGGSWYIQRLLCVESHIKVNLAPSALALPSTNLLSVWRGPWTSSPFSNTEPLICQTFHVFFPHSSPSPECSTNIKVKEVKDAYVRSAPMIAAFSSWCVLERSILMPLPLLNGSLILQNTLLCENNLNDAVPDITAPKRCSSMKRKQAIIDVNGWKMLESQLVLIWVMLLKSSIKLYSRWRKMEGLTSFV